MNQSELTYAEIGRIAKLCEKLEILKLQLGRGYKRTFKDRLAAWKTIQLETCRQLDAMAPAVVEPPTENTLPLEDKSA